MEVWGCAPSGVQGQSPWLGRLGAKPPEAGSFLLCNELIFVCIGSCCGKTASLLYVCNDDRNCMNCMHTGNHIKVAAYLCHNIEKSGSVFRIFCTIYAKRIL